MSFPKDLQRVSFPIFQGVSFLFIVLFALMMAICREASAMILDYGLPNNIDTYGLVSTLWTSCIALGFFIGPSMAGILKDAVGFRSGTMYVVAASAIVSVTTIIFISCWSRRRSTYQKLDDFDRYPWSWSNS